MMEDKSHQYVSPTPRHFNLHLQEMALTPEEFGALRVT